jgi:hypothetical protein
MKDTRINIADSWKRALERAAALREQIQRRYKADRNSSEDSTDVLRKLRKERLR